MSAVAMQSAVENGASRRALVPVQAGERGLVLTSLDEMWRFSQYVAESGFAPKGMDNPKTVLVAIQLGLELGLSPMAAMQSIAVINGRPGIYGDAALALVRGSGLCEAYTQDVDGAGDARTATVTSKRKGQGPLTTTFSVADARNAGLWKKAGPWTQYPDRMLLFRARGFNLRDNFGDVLKGFRTSEELQDIPAEPRAAAPPLGRQQIRQRQVVSDPDCIPPTPTPAAEDLPQEPAPELPGEAPELSQEDQERDAVAKEFVEMIAQATTVKVLEDVGAEMALREEYLGGERFEALGKVYQTRHRELSPKRGK